MGTDAGNLSLRMNIICFFLFVFFFVFVFFRQYVSYQWKRIIGIIEIERIEGVLRLYPQCRYFSLLCSIPLFEACHFLSLQFSTMAATGLPDVLIFQEFS